MYYTPLTSSEMGWDIPLTKGNGSHGVIPMELGSWDEISTGSHSTTLKPSVVFPELLSEPSDLNHSYKNKGGNHIHNHNLSNHHGRAHY